MKTKQGTPAEEQVAKLVNCDDKAPVLPKTLSHLLLNLEYIN
jgi:hypothetical protein